MVTPEQLRLMQRLAQTLWHDARGCLDPTMGELAYQVGIRADADPGAQRLWLEGGDCLAWGWFSPPATLAWAVHPLHPALLDEVLDWAESLAGPGTRLETPARSGDDHAIATLRMRGYVEDPEHIWLRLNHRSVEEIEAPALPTGYALKTVADYGGDIAKRVRVHQRSWAELGTRVSTTVYPGVMSTWPYRQDLDFVLEADDGTPVAFALGWYDEQNRVAEFEPLGTDPDYRNRGLGRTLLLLGLQRLRDAGATDAIVGSRGDAGHRLPSLLYESVGFRQISRQRWFVAPRARS